MPKSYNQLCPIARTLDIVGDRWTMIIIRDLFLGARRFQQLLASSPGIPSRLLSERLKRLEQEGIVGREIYSQHPLRAEYRLTEKGRALEPVMAAMVQWGLDHCFEGDADTRDAVARRISAETSLTL